MSLNNSNNNGYGFQSTQAAYGAVVSNVLGRLNSQTLKRNNRSDQPKDESMSDIKAVAEQSNNEVDDLSMGSISFTSYTSQGTTGNTTIGSDGMPRRRTKSSSKSLQVKWDQMFLRLLEYKKKNGHCLVPNRYTEDRSLGAWVSTQRRQYKVLTSGSNKSTPITLERAHKLNEIGFVWSTTDPRHTPWQKRYEQLHEFHQKYGHSLVPIGFEDNVQLANWVSTQRQEYKSFCDGKPARISKERIRLLNKLGFVWDAQRGNQRMASRYKEKMEDIGSAGPDQEFHVSEKRKLPDDDMSTVMSEVSDTSQMRAQGYLSSSRSVNSAGSTAKKLKTTTDDAELSAVSGMTPSLSSAASYAQATQLLNTSLNQSTAVENAVALVAAAKSCALGRTRMAGLTTSTTGFLMGGRTLPAGIASGFGGLAPLGLAGTAGLPQMDLLANRMRDSRNNNHHQASFRSMPPPAMVSSSFLQARMATAQLQALESELKGKNAAAMNNNKQTE